jgi:hypothetical protein
VHLIIPRVDVRKVLHEETGTVGGYQIYHWDGRVDAIVRPPTLHLRWHRVGSLTPQPELPEFEDCHGE